MLRTLVSVVALAASDAPVREAAARETLRETPVRATTAREAGAREPAGPSVDAAAGREAPGRPLLMDEVLASAEVAFPSLVAARAEVDVADAEQLAAAGGFDPSWRTRAWNIPVGPYPQTRVDSVVEAPTPLWGASFFAGYRLGTGDLPDYYRERETWTGGELRAGAVVPVLRNGPIDKRRAALASAQLGQSVAGQSVEQQRLEVQRLAAVRYWDWVAAGRRREVVRGLLALAQARDAQLAARAGAGDVAQFDRQDNQRALVQREALLVAAQRGVEQAAFQLSLFLRDDAGQPVLPDDARLPAALPEPDANLGEAVDVDDALARRPDVQRLQTRQRQLEVDARLAKNQLLPALDVGVAVSQDVGAAPRPELSSWGKTEVEVSAVLDVPLLYRAPLGKLRAAEAKVRALDAELSLARDKVAVEVRDAVSALRAARERAVLTRREAQVAHALEQGERTRFDLGDSTLLFVNIREQTAAEAELKVVDALADFQKAAAALRAAMAAPRA